MTDCKVVPVVPTIEMAFSGIEVYGLEDCADADVHAVWEAMLDAAPQPAEQQPERDVAALVEALEQYADDHNWCYDTCDIGRDVAKKALAARRKQGGDV